MLLFIVLVVLLYIYIHLTVTGDVFDGVFFVLSYSHEMSLMVSGTELSQFLRVFLPFLRCNVQLCFVILKRYKIKK